VFLVSLAKRLSRWRLVIAATLIILGYVATPLVSLGLKALTDAALTREAVDAISWGLAVTILLVFELMSGHFAHLYYFELGEMQEADLNADLMAIVSEVANLDQLEDRTFKDKLTLIREDLPLTFRALESILQLSGLILQSAATAVILGLLNPWLLLLPLAAVPPVLGTRRAQRVIESAKESAAEQMALSRHLLELTTSVDAIKEIRLYGAERELLARQDRLWTQVSTTLARAHLRASALRAGGQIVFAVAYGGAILLLLQQSADGRASIGDVVLVITLAVQVSLQVSQVLRLISSLQGTAKTVERIQSLRHSVGSTLESGGWASAPSRLERGITLDKVRFEYPQVARTVLSDICLEIPAGSTVALVGENGAGKSTLVKLLCGLYVPTEGVIRVDGHDLRDIGSREWQGRVSALFQDFANFELQLRENVGTGQYELIPDDAAVLDALRQAGAASLIKVVPGGLDGLVGTGYGDGVALSGGQWQSLGLARALMRRRPLLLLLDEPAAALDAGAEQGILQMYRSAARYAADSLGTITLIVSHRLATARLADLIVVLNSGRIEEVGNHVDLMSRGGLYSKLYSTQSRVYQ
jgi:ATP-binding cassette subfamily B protein